MLRGKSVVKTIVRVRNLNRQWKLKAPNKTKLLYRIDLYHNSVPSCP